MVAVQSEIFQIVAAAMLSRDDVLDVKRMEGVVFVSQTAILAAIGRPLSDLFAKLRVHQTAGLLFRNRRALA